MDKIHILLKIWAAFAIGCLRTPAYGAETFTLPDGALSDVQVERSESSILIKMNVHPDAFPDKTNRGVWLIPAIEGNGKKLNLDSLFLAGRTRYYQFQRSNSSSDAILLRTGDPAPYHYSAAIPYQDWMEAAAVTLSGRVSGCGGCELSSFALESPLGNLEFHNHTASQESIIAPRMVYVSPHSEIEKTRFESGEAFVDFPVNNTAIYPDFRRNPEELLKIISTIEDIRSDPDVSIKSISFKGYASPEGPYGANQHLAKGRTRALIDYVQRLYHFPDSALHASWEAEDWRGLCDTISKMDIPDKEDVLAIVGATDIEPDRREQMLKTTYPKLYETLLKEVYPRLRRTDYKVEYLVRRYSDINEIKALLKTKPQKLGINEIFLYAQTLDKGTTEFREVMEIAVRLFPDDPVANLNAAATAVANRDTGRARQCLAKAGDSPEAVYTRGAAEALDGNYREAYRLLRQAEASGLTEAGDLIRQLQSMNLLNYNEISNNDKNINQSK